MVIRSMRDVFRTRGAIGVASFGRNTLTGVDPELRNRPMLLECVGA